MIQISKQDYIINISFTLVLGLQIVLEIPDLTPRLVNQTTSSLAPLSPLVSQAIPIMIS